MFLMGVYEPWMVEIAPTIALTESLAQTVKEVNGMFVESKMYIRCSLISIYTSNSSPHDMINVGLPVDLVFSVGLHISSQHVFVNKDTGLQRRDIDTRTSNGEKNLLEFERKSWLGQCSCPSKKS